MIIDAHCHVASPQVLPRTFMEGWATNLRAQLELGPEDHATVEALLADVTNDESCEELIRQMDAAGIDKSVLLIIDFEEVFGSHGVSLEELHRFHVDLAQRTGRFEVFAGVDPRRGADGVAFLERALRDWGCSGFKIYPPCGFTPSDERLEPFYEVCRQYSVPVLTHVGPTSASLSFEFSLPLQIDGAAKRFPTVNFILAHTGTMYHEDAGLLAEYRPNVFLDVSGFQSQLANGVFARKLRSLLDRGLARKLLFGTDWPIHRMSGEQSTWVQSFDEICHRLEVGGQEKQAMMHRNAERLLTR